MDSVAAAPGYMQHPAVSCISLNRIPPAELKGWSQVHPKIASRVPGGGAPVFHGIRVVEISTYAAAPTAARCMAELGAEVIKVEDPKGT